MVGMMEGLKEHLKAAKKVLLKVELLAASKVGLMDIVMAASKVVQMVKN